MENSKPGFQVWAIAFYLLSTELKGKSSMKLHRDLGMTQKSAWHLAHRIRETWTDGHVPFEGPVEVDETFAGGVEKNKHNLPKSSDRWRVVLLAKPPMVGIKDRATNQGERGGCRQHGSTHLAGIRDGSTCKPGARVYTDDHRRLSRAFRIMKR